MSTWRIDDERAPVRAPGASAYSVGAFLAYVNVEREHNRRPLTLEDWRTRERIRDATRFAFIRRYADTSIRSHAHTWRIDTPIGERRPYPSRVPWRQGRTLVTFTRYAGTLTRDGCTQDATRVSMARAPIDTTFPLSARVTYPADWRDAFYVSHAYSSRGARICATLRPMTFTTDDTKGGES